MYFTDPERDYLNTDCYIGYKTDPLDLETTPQIVFYLKVGTSIIPEDDSPRQTRVPAGTYVLTKVP